MLSKTVMCGTAHSPGIRCQCPGDGPGYPRPLRRRGTRSRHPGARARRGSARNRPVCRTRWDRTGTRTPPGAPRTRRPRARSRDRRPSGAPRPSPSHARDASEPGSNRLSATARLPGPRRLHSPYSRYRRVPATATKTVSVRMPQRPPATPSAPRARSPPPWSRLCGRGDAAGAGRDHSSCSVSCAPRRRSTARCAGAPGRARRHLGRVLRRAVLPRHALPARGRGGTAAPERSLMAGMRGPLYSASDLAEARGLGFEVLRGRGAARMSPEEYGAGYAKRVGDAPAFFSFDIDVIDPAFAPGTGHARGRRPPAARGAGAGPLAGRACGSPASTWWRSRRLTTGPGRPPRCRRRGRLRVPGADRGLAPAGELPTRPAGPGSHLAEAALLRAQRAAGAGAPAMALPAPDWYLRFPVRGTCWRRWTRAVRRSARGR